MSRRQPARKRGRGPPRLLRGDRPYFLALLVLLALLTVMAVAPLQSFTAATARVDDLAARRDDLQARVDRLEAERERLEDPEELELLAREELGLVKPGEIPYVVVTPERSLGELHDEPHDVPAGDAPTWYERLWAGVTAGF